MATMANSGVFVGREAELDLASSALDAARGSAPQIVSIEGEGAYSRLKYEIGADGLVGTAQDVVVLEASGDESEIALEYGVLRQLASRAAQAVGDQSLSDAADEWHSTSAFSAGARLLEILGSLQDEAPVVLAVDDAHWMDTSSASALLFALRRLYADRVLVLIAARPEGVERLGPSWQRFLSDPERVQRVRLGGLTTHEVGQLSSSLGAGRLTLAAAERLREHTDGHPLYVKVLLSELPADAMAFDSGPLPAPHSFAATVISRLSVFRRRPATSSQRPRSPASGARWRSWAPSRASATRWCLWRTRSRPGCSNSCPHESPRNWPFHIRSCGPRSTTTSRPLGGASSISSARS